MKLSLDGNYLDYVSRKKIRDLSVSKKKSLYKKHELRADQLRKSWHYLKYYCVGISEETEENIRQKIKMSEAIRLEAFRFLPNEIAFKLVGRNNLETN